MHDILTTTRATLTDRATELEALIKAGEDRCQVIADDGNEEIKAISEESNTRVKAVSERALAEINVIREELEKHVAELNGVKHSTATIDAIAEKVAPVHLERPMTLAEAEAVMREHQQQDEVPRAGPSSFPPDGSNSVVARFTEKKRP